MVRDTSATKIVKWLVKDIHKFKSADYGFRRKRYKFS